MFLTFCAEAWAGGEAGYIDDLHSKLLARVPVDAAPHHAEGTPATHTQMLSSSQTPTTAYRHKSEIEQMNSSRFSWHLSETHVHATTHTHTHHTDLVQWADTEPFLRICISERGS